VNKDVYIGQKMLRCCPAFSDLFSRNPPLTACRRMEWLAAATEGWTAAPQLHKLSSRDFFREQLKCIILTDPAVHIPTSFQSTDRGLCEMCLRKTRRFFHSVL